MITTVENIWHEFAEKLRNFIRRRVGDDATADDILQDVFVKIASRLSTLDDPGKLQGWIFLIARHAVIDHYRTRKETVEVPETLHDESASDDPDIEPLKAAFRRMIDALPEPYRAAVTLTELEGLTQKELAARLGISLSGAKSRVQRGREQLRQNLVDCCRFEFDRRGRVIDCTPHRQESCPECP
ncbi:MAG TPA: RNA polymerase sigma factor SigZ [Methylomirabilota bacterium]|nr:RNA polymerase sigma factor SigZ [Methylomirabilota bacterium]